MEKVNTYVNFMLLFIQSAHVSCLSVFSLHTETRTVHNLFCKGKGTP
jgi:hypothetical protein